MYMKLTCNETANAKEDMWKENNKILYFVKV